MTDALLHPAFRETLDVLSRPPVIDRTPWDDFLERVELRSGRELVSPEDFAKAWTAHCAGVTADDYALTLKAEGA